MESKPITDEFLKYNSDVIASCVALGVSFEDFTTDEVCLGHNMKKLGRTFRKGKEVSQTAYCPECDMEIYRYKENEKASKQAFLNRCAVEKQENAGRSHDLRAKKKEARTYGDN